MAVVPDQVRFEKMLENRRVTQVQFTLDFLKRVTSDFSVERVLGHGGFGVVYKGVLQNGREIAVKRLKILETNLDDDQYHKELKYLSRLDHENIVQFKGYCAHSSEVLWPVSESQGRDKCIVVEERERILCFEYVPNKSLREHISDASCGLEWPVRYEIIKGICSGLHYLHKEHDFGTSRLFGGNQSRIITKSCVGSRGYMAPEYLIRGMISKKADIFSFGVIILELITGSRFDYPQSGKSFTPFIADVVEKWAWRGRLPDPSYCEQVRTCISIALNCVDDNPDRRYTTELIMKKLNEVEDPRRPWSSAQITRFLVAISFGAVVRILLNPHSSWSWLLTILMNDVLPAVIIVAIAVTAVVHLILYVRMNHSNTRRWVIKFTVGLILSVVPVLLNSSGILFTLMSSGLTTLKFVIMARITLFAIGVVTVLLIHSHSETHFRSCLDTIESRGSEVGKWILFGSSSLSSF